jgi:hypothetical protein
MRRRLSSELTFVYKRVFPVMWFVILAAFAAIALTATPASQDHFSRLMFIAAPIFMAVFGYFVFRKLVFDLVDEVVDEGDSLVVKNRGKSDRIALSDIKNVSYSTMINPTRVTLSLRKPSIFGDEVTFCALFRLVPFSSHPTINAFIERVDAAREGRKRPAGA